MDTVVRIDGNVQWQSIRGQGGNWVAVCEPLKITLQAETWADLMEEIASTLDALLKDLVSANEFDQFMRERGWSVLGRIPVHAEKLRFDVPFFLAMQGANDSKRTLHQ